MNNPFSPIFDLAIRSKAAVGPTDLSAFSGSGRGWWPVLREPFSGAWQRNLSQPAADLLSAGPVWACVTLIANDFAKVGVNLIALRDGIWEETTNSAYSPVLRKPNDYQNRITFFQSWMISKLTQGNTYVLKARNQRGGTDALGMPNGNVSALYVLDPTKVQPLVTPDGSVYYRLGSDQLTGIDGAVAVPASEIIHDLYAPLYHPLCGVPPLYACGLPASLGLKIRTNSTSFFDNRSNLDGILVAPNTISAETAKKLEDYWNENYSGPQNAGKIAALGDGLKFEPMSATAKDSELSEQLKDAALEVCAAFHVPAWLVGFGPEPNYNNGESKYQQYYNQCLQILYESAELCLDEGLDLPNDLGIEFDVENLLRMDSIAQMDKLVKGVQGSLYTPNEGRKAVKKRPIAGGDAIYMQQQNYSLSALAKRDSSDDPFGKAVAPPAPPPAPPPDTTPKEAQLDDLAITALSGHLGRIQLKQAA